MPMHLRCKILHLTIFNLPLGTFLGDVNDLRFYRLMEMLTFLGLMSVRIEKSLDTSPDQDQDLTIEDLKDIRKNNHLNSL